jgi:outer membrane protein TolC
MKPVPFHPFDAFERACRARTALCLLVLFAAPAYAADRADPFDTAKLRPAAPSQFWNGPAATCAHSDTIPDPLRLVDAVDLALCNNPQTRLSWANAKASAAQVGIARSGFLPEVDANVSLQRSETWNVPGANGQTSLNGSISFN